MASHYHSRVQSGDSAYNSSIPLLDLSPDPSSVQITRPPSIIKRKPLSSSFRNGPADAKYTALNEVADDGLQLPNDSARPEPETRHVATEEFNSEPADWQPYTLRSVYLLGLVTFTCILCATVAVLLWYSYIHAGLGKDDGSSAILFGWRFTPTLVAVVYVLLTAVLLDDVKRTEPFARMARRNASAESTILQEPGPWYTALVDGLKQRKNEGHVSWILIWSSLLNVVGFLIISPLSSALLLSDSVTTTESIEFTSISMDSTTSLSIQAEDRVYFRTVSNLLYNITTSAWLMDKYAVVPFWPSAIDMPLSDSLSNSTETWQGNTTVLTTQMDCEPLKLISKEAVSHTYKIASSEYWTITPSINLTSDDGCSYRLDPYSYFDIVSYGGGTWSDIGNFSFSVWSSHTPLSLFWFNSTGCKRREFILMTTEFGNSSTSWRTNSKTWAPDFQAKAEVCTTNFYMGSLPVQASNTALGSTVLSFDEKVFEDVKAPIPASILDANDFQSLFLNPNWTTKLWHDGYPDAGGPLSLLASTYGYNMRSAIKDSHEDTVATAVRLKQRFLGELMMSAFQKASNHTTVRGTVGQVQRKIVVNGVVATILAAVLFLSAILILGILYNSRSRRRPLNLKEDPSTAIAMAKMIQDPRILSTFDGLDSVSPNILDESLRGSKWMITQSSSIIPAETIETYNHLETKQGKAVDWKPATLRRSTGLLLMVFLSAILATIITLFCVSQSSGLNDTAFVYSYQFHKLQEFIPTIAPFSIVPTLVAVFVTLWWGSLDETMRRLQPYVSMAEKPVPISSGAALSYVTSYLLWAAGKALSKRHLLLAYVCVGSFLGEIFTIAMSALWSREPATTLKHATMAEALEIRSIPLLFDLQSPIYAADHDAYRTATLKNLYYNTSVDWLYGATIELTFNASEPAWSHEDWAFTPLQLSSLPDFSSFQNTGTNPSNTSGSGANVTLIRPALRARLECTPYDTLGNYSSWISEVDLTNTTIWNVTANPPAFSPAYELNPSGMVIKQPENDLPSIVTPFFGSGNHLQCCANVTDSKDGRAAMGYWSYNDPGFVGNRTSTSMGAFPQNFTVKWIVGTPVSQQYALNSTSATMFLYKLYDSPDYISHLIWKDIPQLTAVNCQPIIEAANVSVTVDKETGTVYESKLVSAPQPLQEAWAHVYAVHNQSSPNATEVNVEIGPDPSSTVAIDNYASHNVSCSFGVLFQDSLLTSSDLTQFNVQRGSQVGDVQWLPENLDEDTYNIRINGLNVDFPSYAMYYLAGEDSQALLDPDVLQKYASRAFSIYFKHFASTNLTVTEGGWAFQRYGETLPKDLGNFLGGAETGGIYYNSSTTLPMNSTVDVEVVTSIEQLKMSTIAVGLCLGVLGFLLIGAMLVFLVDYGRFSLIKGDVKTVASIIRLIYDSPKLLYWAQQAESVNTPTKAKHEIHQAKWRKDSIAEGREPRVQLGTFVGKSGKQRWAMEIVGRENA